MGAPNNHGGTTALKKIASLAEAFGIKWEIHVSPNPWMDVANLHVICSMKNYEFYEWFVPDEILQFGVKETLKLDDEGYVHVPQGPGLGLEPDWGYINNHTIQTL
jgi:L-alanine-DL-glutamate epimerase-like enolase superfamily enzyme